MSGNVLNELSGGEWVEFTKSCWTTNYPLDVTWGLRKILRTTKSPEAMRDIIMFFTKSGERVLDPFAGVGSTLIGAYLCDREAVGIEINKECCDVFEEIKNRYAKIGGRLVEKEEPGNPWPIRMVNDDCMNRLELLGEQRVDFILCDPPHGPQDNGGEEGGNLGQTENIKDYLDKIGELSKKLYRVLKLNKYCVVIMRDRYQDGEWVPLTHMVSEKMTEHNLFNLKAIKVWFHEPNSRNVRVYRVGEAFVPTIVHDNLIILQRNG